MRSKKGKTGVRVIGVDTLGLRVAQGVNAFAMVGESLKGRNAGRNAGSRQPMMPTRAGVANRTYGSGQTRVSLPDSALLAKTRELVRTEFGGASNVVTIDSEDPLVTQAIAEMVARVTEIVAARRETLSQQNIDALVDAYLKTDSIAHVRGELELDNARERARFVESFDCFTSKQIAQFAGHEAANASATATRWKKAGRIFSLPFKDGDLYPAFQFVDGQPRAVVQQLLAIFGARRTPWQIAFWMTSGNSWLDGAAPVERLDDAPALVAAAGQEMDAVFG